MQTWNTKTRVFLLGLSFSLIACFSSFGYYLIKKLVEDQTVGVMDSIYWTIVTLTTLGAYPGNVGLTSDIGKLFTVGIVLTGVLLIFVGVPLTAAPWLERRLRGFLEPRRAPIPAQNHVILVEYSDVGKQVVEELKIHEVPFVVIENREDKLRELRHNFLPYVDGNPTDDHVLIMANIDTALSLILTGEDSTNAYVCLAANHINPEIQIVANLQNPKHENVLLKAGATKVVSSKSLVGILLAKRAVGMYDLNIIDSHEAFKGLEMSQYTITKASPLRGVTLRSTRIGQNTGATVLGVWSKGEIEFNPPPNYVLKEGVILVVIGSVDQLKMVDKLLSGGVLE
jgi:voltage-gated potassium channel